MGIFAIKNINRNLKKNCNTLKVFSDSPSANKYTSLLTLMQIDIEMF